MAAKRAINCTAATRPGPRTRRSARPSPSRSAWAERLEPPTATRPRRPIGPAPPDARDLPASVETPWEIIYKPPPCRRAARDCTLGDCPFADCIWQRLARLRSLPKRQVQILRLRLSSQYDPPKEQVCAADLGIKRGTIHRHKVQLYAKFGVSTAAGLISAALRDLDALLKSPPQPP